MSDKFQIPAVITKITTMADRSLRLQVDSQELGSEEKAKVFGLHEKFGWFVFSTSEITEKDFEDLPDIPQPKTDDDKTPSQRLRGVLYRIWEQKGKKDLYNRESDFDTYYLQIMNQIINKYKEKLE